MNNGKRIFLTTVISSSMLSELFRSDTCLQFVPVKEGIDILKNMDFISALKDEAIVNFLNKKGINKAVLNPEEYIELFPGDTLYVINPKTSREARRDKELPDHTVMTITKCVAWKTSNLAKQHVIEALDEN